jgi:serine/threonine-protein kinase RIO1
VQSPHGFEFLHRDVSNVTRWFQRFGVRIDVELVYAEPVAFAF